MAKIKTKKRKLVQKIDNKKSIDKTKINKKKKKKKNIPKLKKPLPPLSRPTNTTDSDSDSDSDSEPSSPESIQKLLDPYTKDQLIEFIVDAALKTPSLFTRITETADRDVSHRKIFVHGLGWDTTRQTLASAFEPFGEIEECNVVVDRATGKAKGFGFILFKSGRAATKALKQPKKKINNRIASCQLASVGPMTSQSQDMSSRKIYVSNVRADVDPEKLRAFFEKFGEIETGPIGFDMQTGKSRGFALFVYKNQEGVNKVLEEPFKVFDGHQLHCQKAAEGKNSNLGALQPLPAAPGFGVIGAAQNLALFGQQQGLNPLYSALLSNPNAGLLAKGLMNPLIGTGGFGQGMIGSGQVGQMGGLGGATGMSSYGGVAGQGLGSLGGSQSVLGAYGGPLSNAPMWQGLLHAYPNRQMGQSPATGGQGAGGSFSGYPSNM